MVTLRQESTSLSPVGRIEILGMFGAGKSTLMRKVCAESNLTAVPEDHSGNPFWTDRFALKTLGSLPYDLTFLLQHASISVPREGSAKQIADWSFLTDDLWASHRLDAEDLKAFRGVLAAVQRHISPTLGYLYIKTSAEVLLERLRKRGRRNERGLNKEVDTAIRVLDACIKERIDPQRLIVVDGSYTSQEIVRQIDAWELVP